MSLFLIYFAVLWLFVTTILGSISGWYRLAKRYPDKDETPLKIFRGKSGYLGGVQMRGILRLSVCPSGLRIGIVRLFGPFCQNFLVPWNEISITRTKKALFFGPMTKLELGIPPSGEMVLFQQTAKQIADSVPGKWPDIDSIPNEKKNVVAMKFFKWWLIQTAFATTFLIVASRIMSPRSPIPIFISILLPAFFFGILTLFSYWTNQKDFE